MSRKKNRYPFIENIEIIDIGAEGKAIAKYNERVVFIPHAVPGDVIDVQVNKRRKKFFEAYPVKFHKKSELRVKPFCDHFGTCGGCKWQMLPYKEQLRFKEQQVRDQLTRIGKISEEEAALIQPILGSERTSHYRNKLEYTFSNKKWITKEQLESGEDIPDRNALGFHIPGMFDKVLDIEECHLQAEPSNSIRNWLRAYTGGEGLEYFDIRKQEGLMRNVVIRTTDTGEVMVIVVFYREEKDAREKLLTKMKEEFPQITSLMYVINTKQNDTILDQDIILFSGRDHIIEEMEELKFKVGPKSFYQTNPAQAYRLYSVAREFAQLKGDELVYDLYTGTGTIALFMAKQAGELVGVEYVPEAIEDAKVNAKNNGIDNTHFYAGDMKDVFTSTLVEKHGKPDVIVMDPPRAGIHPDVAKALLASDAPRIVYVSCNPATQARDIQLLSETYAIKAIQPVDMFPQTHHVENVVLLEKK